VLQLACASVLILAKYTNAPAVPVLTLVEPCFSLQAQAWKSVTIVHDLIWRSLTRAGIPSVKEPQGLTRSDGKRPGGLKSIPWREGLSATWDVTVTNTVAASYVAITSARAAAAAEAAAQRKEIKYAAIAQTHLFYPLASSQWATSMSLNLSSSTIWSSNLSSHWWKTRDLIFVPTHFSCHQRFNAVIFFKFFLPHRWQHGKPSETHL